MPSKNTKVLLAEDHEMVRAGLKALLATQAGVEVVGEAKTGRGAVQLAAEMSPDVIIMDIHMPDMDGITATREIRASGSTSKVIGLSGMPDPHYSIEILKAGASAFVFKESAFAELASAVAAVIDNKVYLSPRAMPLQDQTHGNGANSNGSHYKEITPRERDVLALMANGKSTKEIAAALKLSVKTIETHRKNIMEKLEIYSIAELTKYAIREGISTLEA